MIEIHEIIDWSAPFVEISAIFVAEKESKNFHHSNKVKLFISKASNSCPKNMDFFQMLLAS